uniref:Uncharacterized protein n=1 Tax=Setaria italica TaxID=4555 RepID=K3YMY0_SETIT
MNISLRDRIRKRREEEDDDMMMFLFPALYLMGSAREGGVKKKRHTSEETGEVKVRRLLEGHIKNCQVTFRMEPHIFKELATYLRRKRIVVDTRIMIEEKLGFFLYMLSRNTSYEDLAVTFGHSNDTFHRHINHFFKKFIPTLSRRFLQSPDPNQVHPNIQDNPRFYPFFKNCLGCNKMVKEFHRRNKSVSYTRAQIQDKECQLKRYYKMLKAARMQSGSKWNEQRNMVEGSAAMWENLMVTFPKIKKFQNNKASFPLFDALGELYDEPLHQIDDEIHETRDEDDEEKDARDEEEARSGQRRMAASRKKPEKEGQRPRKSAKIEAMMERFLETRTKQAEDEAKQLARENEARENEIRDKKTAKSDEFSIKRCISIINTMENKENRETFICASEEDEESALIWLRNEMA